MLGKARLIKKDALGTTARQPQTPTPKSEKSERIQFTQQIVRTTKDWLASNRHQAKNARQAFAALFINEQTQGNTA